MKMVKSLLLGGAAGLVAAAGAQAADLPVKAKPVEYVKVCSLYGAGFYYIPGTDICLKLGGYVRYQVNGWSGNDISFGPFRGASGYDTRSSEVTVAQRVRAIMTIDTRQQTAYGTLRTYFLFGYTHDTTNSTIGPSVATGANIYANRGFIQIAGFTLGKATSFFDFVSTAAVAYNAGFVHTSDTGDAGQIVGAYTAQFGNGLSASIAIEQSRRNPTVWTGTNAFVAGTGVGFGITGATAADVANQGGLVNAGASWLPDIVGNIRVDQAWGSAQIAGAAHNVNASYYGPAFTTASGHPDDKWGWAISGGLRLNAPMIGPGDYFQTAINYSQGAIRYVAFSGCGQGPICDRFSGNEFAFGQTPDAVFYGTAAAPGSFDLTTAWSIFASYEHFWTPSLRTSLYGSYLDVSFNGNANVQICNAVTTTAQMAAFFAGTFACDMNWSMWNVGSRSQWNVTKDFYVGVDVIYQKLQSANLNNGAPFVPFGALIPPNRPGGVAYRTADQDAVSVTWRVHRDIVP